MHERHFLNFWLTNDMPGDFWCMQVLAQLSSDSELSGRIGFDALLDFFGEILRPRLLYEEISVWKERIIDEKLRQPIRNSPNCYPGTNRKFHYKSDKISRLDEY